MIYCKRKHRVCDRQRTGQICLKRKWVCKHFWRAADKLGKAAHSPPPNATLQHSSASLAKQCGSKNVFKRVATHKGGVNKAAIQWIYADPDSPIIIRQVKSPNNVVGQDLGVVRRAIQPMPNFRSIRSAKCVLLDYMLSQLNRKDQIMLHGCQRCLICQPSSICSQGKYAKHKRSAPLAANITIHGKRNSPK